MGRDSCLVTRRGVCKLLGVGAGAVLAAPFLPKLTKETMNYRLGKLPARNTVRLKLKDYYTSADLPPLPSGDFGHQNLISDWKMLGNGPDPANPPGWPHGAGDCAIAGPFHAIMLWNAVAGKTVNVNTACVLKEYSDITGFNASQPWTDQGSNAEDVAQHWQATGLTDASGVNHRIDGFVALEPGNLQELWYATYLFDAVGIGVNFPGEWMTAFNQGSTWEKLPSPTFEGGHYILGVGRVSGYIDTITWGRQQLLSPAGYQQCNDETIAYVSSERLLASGKDLNGFDLKQLLADLAALPSV